jgi:hypothetical protein
MRSRAGFPTRFVSYKVFGSTHGAKEREVLAKNPCRQC